MKSYFILAVLLLLVLTSCATQSGRADVVCVDSQENVYFEVTNAVVVYYKTQDYYSVQYDNLVTTIHQPDNCEVTWYSQ